MKKCTKCKVRKPLIEFPKDKSRKDGIAYRCKKCNSIRWGEISHTQKDHYKQYYIDNKEKMQTQFKAWKKRNPNYMSEYNLEFYYKNKYRFKWRSLLDSSLKTLTTDKDATTQTLLGYSSTQLKEHLDKQEMDWDKHQIDHKIPISWFKKDTPPHIVNDLRNLQPLSEEENKSKGNRYADEVDDDYYKIALKWIERFPV